jgi:hypothetical protein
VIIGDSEWIGAAIEGHAEKNDNQEKAVARSVTLIDNHIHNC